MSIDNWERKHIYEGFRACEFPFLVVGANVNLGNSPEYWKTAGISPYLACVYAICKAANEIPAFRQRMRGDDLIEYDTVHADFTVPAGEASFTIRQIPFTSEFQPFYQAASSKEDVGFIMPGDITELDHWIFMSCLPWISFTHVMQPMQSLKNDCIPRIVWGKFSQQGSLWNMPISVQAHHSLVDGLHIAQLLSRLENYFANPESTFQL